MKQTAKQTKPETKMVNVTWCYRAVLVLVGVGVTWWYTEGPLSLPSPLVGTSYQLTSVARLLAVWWHHITARYLAVSRQQIIPTASPPPIPTLSSLWTTYKEQFGGSWEFLNFWQKSLWGFRHNIKEFCHQSQPSIPGYLFKIKEIVTKAWNIWKLFCSSESNVK